MIGVYAGSFDPWTNGHEDVLLQAFPLFSRIYILICDNPKKKHEFSLSERYDMISKYIDSLEYSISNNIYAHMETDSVSTISIAVNVGADYLIRGIRSVSDFEYELQVASMNKIIDSNIHTMYFTPSVNNQFTSSSMVREFMRINEDYTKLVPASIAEYIKASRKGY